MNENYNFSDPKKIKEILDIISKKIPGLLKELSNILYSEDNAKKYAKSAAIFYKELKKTGMSGKEAFELTSQYLSALNLGDVIGKMMMYSSHKKNMRKK